MRCKDAKTANDDMNYRENALKNVVMRIIIDVRDRKKRPKLSDFLSVYRERKGEENAKEEV